jgi:hypothetical protein
MKKLIYTASLFIFIVSCNQWETTDTPGYKIRRVTSMFKKTGAWDVSEGKFEDGTEVRSVSLYPLFLKMQFPDKKITTAGISINIDEYDISMMFMSLDALTYSILGTYVNFTAKNEKGQTIKFTMFEVTTGVYHVLAKHRNILCNFLLSGGSIKFLGKYTFLENQMRCYFEIPDASYLVNALDLAGIEYK